MLLVCSATSQVTRAHGRYLFRARYRKGEVERFSTRLVVPAPGQSSAQVSNPVILKVLAVKGDTAKVDISVGPAVQITRKGKGKVYAFPKHNVLHLNTLNHSVDSDVGANVLAMFPPRPVAVGETWQGLSTFPMGNSKQILNTTYKFSGIQRRGRTTAAVLDVELSGFAGGNGSMLIDVKDGSLLASVLNMMVGTSEYNAKVSLVVRRESSTFAKKR